MLWVLLISAGLLAYTYLGYPVLIWVLARVRGRPVRTGRFEGGVAVLIAARNEAATLPEKLVQLLALARTEPIREIWIGLDGCTDGTGAAVRERIQNSEFRIQNDPAGHPQPATCNLEPEIRISNIQYPISNDQVGGQPPNSADQQSTSNGQPAVHILNFDVCRGKAAVVNELVPRATQPVLVMMDARQRVEAGAISKLLEGFADPRVGVVSGALVYESAQGAAQKGAESYWGYEKFIREAESRFWAVPGATGALYAIRRELVEPIPANTLVDDVLIPMRAVCKGFRCLFEPAARVYDRPTARFEQEGLRKRRTLAGIWQLWRLEPDFFSMFKNPIWFQWISHKFLRLFTPFFVFFIYFSLFRMSFSGVDLSFWLLFASILALLLSGGAFFGQKRFHSRGLGLLGAFFGVNQALLLAAWDAWSGRFEGRWK